MQPVLKNLSHKSLIILRMDSDKAEVSGGQWSSVWIIIGIISVLKTNQISLWLLLSLKLTIPQFGVRL